MKNVEIQTYIQSRLDEMVMSADEVLVRLSDQARATMTDFVTVDPVLDEETGFFDQCAIDLEKAQRLGKMHLIKKISFKKTGIAIELHDSQAALKLIGQHHKLFSMRHSLDVEKDSKLEEWLNALTGAKKSDEVAEPDAEVGDIPPDGSRSEPEPGETTP